MTAPSEAQQQYLHLTRLAWGLRMLGADVVLDLAPTAEPVVAVRRAAGDRLRVTAMIRSGRWMYVWGRGRTQCAGVGEDDAARVIRKAAR
ncbi:hypothetical protein [Spongiactinospora rosea]|uniref:hypothetical protein n=1 Tax=Spongiactinospora rosea TaxID=2248750 RepID=UPI0011C01988|nr:hypothetical protein [Spongiactinospora rosea]